MSPTTRRKVEEADPILRLVLKAVVTVAVMIVAPVMVAMANGAREWANNMTVQVTTIGAQFSAFQASFVEYKQRQERSEAEHAAYRREIDGKLTGIVDRLTKIEESRRATERFGTTKP